MSFKTFARLGPPALLITLLALAAACGADEGPEDLTFELQITERELDLDPPVVKVRQDDIVTLRIKADEDGTLHLHGYDIESAFGEDETGTMSFTANATGRFPMAFHPAVEGGEDHGHEEEDSESSHEVHGDLFASGAIEAGESFSYDLGQDLSGETFPYHNHMHHEFTGSITVSEGADLSGTVEVEMTKEGSFNPDQVSLKRDSTIVWTNNTGERQAIASGPPPAGEHEEEDATEEGGTTEEVEITVGTLEVRPR